MQLNESIKEWAYAGFFFLRTGALCSYIVMGDADKSIFGPLFQTVLSFYRGISDHQTEKLVRKII